MASFVPLAPCAILSQETDLATTPRSCGLKIALYNSLVCLEWLGYARCVEMNHSEPNNLKICSKPIVWMQLHHLVCHFQRESESEFWRWDFMIEAAEILHCIHIYIYIYYNIYIISVWLKPTVWFFMKFCNILQLFWVPWKFVSMPSVAPDIRISPGPGRGQPRWWDVFLDFCRIFYGFL